MKKQKNKKSILFLVLLLLVMFGFVPPLPQANAIDALTNAYDKLSDSDTSVSSTHTVVFITATTTPASGYYEIVIPTEFGDIAAAGNVTCPAGWTRTRPNTETARCTADAQYLAGTGATTTITAVTNPSSEGSYTVRVNLYNSTGGLISRVQLPVAIINDVWMTATVDATLTFTITGVSSSTVVNSVTCNMPTTATTAPFGTLKVGTAKNICQRLNVTTNSDDGFTVTVEQNHELLSDSGSNINSFNNSPDNTGSTTAQVWAVPKNTLDVYDTYGHMGLSSDDSDLSSLGGYNNFYHGGVAWYAGLNSTNPMPVMHHNGPADGLTDDKGQADIIFRAQIGSLQEAGDYESQITYICTAVY
jgi:hypothetical protein